MGKYTHYARIDELFRTFIKEVKAYDRFSEKTRSLPYGGQYEEASVKLHYDAAALEKMRHRLMKEIEACGLSGYIPEDPVYYPSNFHEVK